MNPLPKRLELIKTAIALEDDELIELQLTKLESLANDEATLAIIDSLKQQRLHQALQQIDTYLRRLHGLVVYDDGELNALRLELKKVEKRVDQLTEQRDEQQFQLDQFHYRYQLELGDRIRAILNLRQNISFAKVRQQREAFEAQQAEYRRYQAEVEALKQQREALEAEQQQYDEFDDSYEQFEEALEQINEALRAKQEQLKAARQRTKAAKEALEERPEQQEYVEAQREYAEFDQTHEEIVQEKREVLKGESAEELKKLFRKAARLCHPDIVADELKEQATRMMQALNDARNRGDLAAVRELFEKLQQGIGFVVASDKLTDKKQLRAKIEQLRHTLSELEAEIAAIEASETWQNMPDIDMWDDYFEQMQAELSQEADRLDSELAALDEAYTLNRDADNPPDDNDAYWREAF